MKTGYTIAGLTFIVNEDNSITVRDNGRGMPTGIHPKMGIPAVIHEQNVYPGLTVKGSINYVDYIAVSFKETLNYIKKKDKDRTNVNKN